MVRGSDKQAYVWNRPPRAASLGTDIAEFMRELDKVQPHRRGKTEKK